MNVLPFTTHKNTMNPTPLATLRNDFVDGQVIPSVSGSVSWIENPKTGIGKQNGKPWTLQGITLESNGSKLKAVIWNPKVQFTKGQTVEFQSKKDQHGRLGGVTLKREFYQDRQSGEQKESVQLTVSEGAVILGAQANTNIPTQPGAPGGQAGASQPYQSSGSEGQRAGMAVKAAVDIWIATHGAGGEGWNVNGLNLVRETARQLIGMSKELERGVITPPGPGPKSTPRQPQAEQGLEDNMDMSPASMEDDPLIPF